MLRRPIKPLLSVHMPSKQRRGLIFLLIVSLLPCIAGLLRLYYLEAFYNDIDELCKSPRSPYTPHLTAQQRERQHHLGADDARDEPRRRVRMSVQRAPAARNAPPPPLRDVFSPLAPLETLFLSLLSPSTSPLGQSFLVAIPRNPPRRPPAPPKRHVRVSVDSAGVRVEFRRRELRGEKEGRVVRPRCHRCRYRVYCERGEVAVCVAWRAAVQGCGCGCGCG